MTKKKSARTQGSAIKWGNIGSGEIWLGDSLEKMKRMRKETVDLIFTSPPFPLIRKKSYGNRSELDYIEWLMPFIAAGKDLLKDTGSIVIDLGCCWEKGRPIRSTYDMRLTLEIIDRLGLSLAQEFYWYNPSRLPGPAQWVTVEKIRVKDSVNKILWFTKKDYAKADNRKILQPYSDSMENKLKKGIRKGTKRPSGHTPSAYLNNRKIGSIPGNLLAIANSNRHDSYLSYCSDLGFKPHPARFPYEIPEFFIKFLTDEGDKVLDPFAGSCTTGNVANRLKRRWVCIEKEADYLQTASGHFIADRKSPTLSSITLPRTGIYANNMG